MIELSNDQFNKLSQQIYLRLGLQFEEKKAYFLQKRVEKRMEALGYQDAQEYVFQLCYADSDGREMQALANLINVHVPRVRATGGVFELLPSGGALGQTEPR